MSIKTDYNFKGIEVKDSIIRIDRIFGSSKDGWTSLVGVYNLTTETVDEVHETEGTEKVEAYIKTVYNKFDEFNFYVLYKEEERGYKTMYAALTEKFGGIEV